jgi:hypothetical protein
VKATRPKQSNVNNKKSYSQVTNNNNNKPNISINLQQENEMKTEIVTENQIQTPVPVPNFNPNPNKNQKKQNRRRYAKHQNKDKEILFLRTQMAEMKSTISELSKIVKSLAPLLNRFGAGNLSRAEVSINETEND